MHAYYRGTDLAGSRQLKSTTTDEDDDQALYALSTSNVVSTVLGGFGGCGLIPNTLLNLQSGGRGMTSGVSRNTRVRGIDVRGVMGMD